MLLVDTGQAFYIRGGTFSAQDHAGVEDIQCRAGNPVGYLIISSGDVSDLEVKGLEEGSPAADNRGLGGLDPLEIAVVCLYQELLAAEVPGERVH